MCQTALNRSTEQHQRNKFATQFPQSSDMFLAIAKYLRAFYIAFFMKTFSMWLWVHFSFIFCLCVASTFCFPLTQLLGGKVPWKVEKQLPNPQTWLILRWEKGSLDLPQGWGGWLLWQKKWNILGIFRLEKRLPILYPPKESVFVSSFYLHLSHSSPLWSWKHKLPLPERCLYSRKQSPMFQNLATPSPMKRHPNFTQLSSSSTSIIRWSKHQQHLISWGGTGGPY